MGALLYLVQEDQRALLDSLPAYGDEALDDAVDIGNGSNTC